MKSLGELEGYHDSVSTEHRHIQNVTVISQISKLRP